MRAIASRAGHKVNFDCQSGRWAILRLQWKCDCVCLWVTSAAERDVYCELMEQQLPYEQVRHMRASYWASWTSRQVHSILPNAPHPRVSTNRRDFRPSSSLARVLPIGPAVREDRWQRCARWSHLERSDDGLCPAGWVDMKVGRKFDLGERLVLE